MAIITYRAFKEKLDRSRLIRVGGLRNTSDDFNRAVLDRVNRNWVAIVQRTGYANESNARKYP